MPGLSEAKTRSGRVVQSNNMSIRVTMSGTEERMAVPARKGVGKSGSICTVTMDNNIGCLICTSGDAPLGKKFKTVDV